MNHKQKNGRIWITDPSSIVFRPKGTPTRQAGPAAPLGAPHASRVGTISAGGSIVGQASTGGDAGRAPRPFPRPAPVGCDVLARARRKLNKTLHRYGMQGMNEDRKVVVAYGVAMALRDDLGLNKTEYRMRRMRHLVRHLRWAGLTDEANAYLRAYVHSDLDALLDLRYDLLFIGLKAPRAQFVHWSQCRYVGGSGDSLFLRSEGRRVADDPLWLRRRPSETALQFHKRKFSAIVADCQRWYQHPLRGRPALPR